MALWLLLGLAWGGLADRVAAVVEEDVIALSEIYELGAPFIEQRCPGGEAACRREAELQILDTLILRLLIRQELDKLGYDVTTEEIDRAIDQIGRENGIEDRERLKREIEAGGMSWEIYREQVAEQLRTMKFREGIIRPRISITEDEIVDLYKRSTRDLETPETATVEAIVLQIPAGGGEAAMVEAVTSAEEIRTRVRSGEITWEEAVAEYHSGVLSGPDGSMPPVTRGELMPALDTIIFSTPEGEIGDPALISSFVILPRVLERNEGGTRTFEEARPELEQRLAEAKIEEQVEQWYQQMRRQSAVRVLLETPESL